MTFLRRALVGVFLLALTLAGLALAGRTVFDAVQSRLNAEPRSFPQRERVIAVNVVPFTTAEIVPELTAFGEVRSRRTLDLRPGVGGTVVEIAPNFAEGGEVSEGTLLLRIDPADAETTLARAQTDLLDAEAEVRDAERALALARDELSAAEDQVTLRAQALTRQEDLTTRGVGTAAATEAAELALSSARQSVLARRQALAQAEARLDQSRTRMARAELGVSDARRTLDATEVRAAFTGTLADVSVAEGGRVTANEQVARLVDPAALEVAFRVSTSQYARLLDAEGQLIGAPVRATLDVAGVDLAALGRISREGAAVGEGQTGRLLFATLNDARGFRPGDFVTVRIDEPPLSGVARLPSTALAADETLLLVGADDRLEAAPAELLRRQGDDVLVRADLEGRMVVAERSPLLGAGIKVRPIPPGGPAEEMADAAPEMLRLDADRKARLVAFVEGSRMPQEAKARILAQLEQEEVPADVVTRLESRMGS